MNIKVPTKIYESDAVSWKGIGALAQYAEADPVFAEYLESMPDNYYHLFSPDEVVEHFHFLKRNSIGELGELPADSDLELRGRNHIVLIMDQALSSFVEALKKIDRTGRRVVHHHSFVPRRGRFQILFMQTTDEHYQPLTADLFRQNEMLLNADLELEKREFQRIEGSEASGIVGKRTEELKAGTLGTMLETGEFGDPAITQNLFFEIFLPSLNIAFRRGLDIGKISEIAATYLQFVNMELGSLCYIRKTQSGLLKVTCMGRGPSFMRSQRYLVFLAERLTHYIKHAVDSASGEYEYRGGFSTFFRGSGNQQIETCVFYLKPPDGFEEAAPEGPSYLLGQELSLDLAYKIVQTFNELSLFDIMGPRMVGPSSSHTAGANRLGRIARNIIHAALESGKIKGPLYIAAHLYKSFELTGEGHGTPNAVLGGLMGFDQADERIADDTTNPSLVKTVKIKDIEIPWCGYKRAKYLDDSYHGNTVLFMINDSERFDDHRKTLLYIIGESYGGGNVQISEIGGKIAAKSIRFNTSARDRFTGKRKELLPEFFSRQEVMPIFDYPPLESRGIAVDIERPKIVDLDDVLWYHKKTSMTLPEIAIAYELSTQGIVSGSTVLNEMQRTSETMDRIVRQGIDPTLQSRGRFSGGSGLMMDRYAERHSHETERLYLKAAAYAIAVAERNASHKEIVAAPTGGACGIIPGVLAALREYYRFTEQECVDGLLTAALIGLVVNNTVPTAGATHGCQAEIGIGCGMAAAMTTQMLGGTVDQVLNATALALKNSLGLVCDPIAGKVEVPCIKRNGFKAVEAIIAARMSLGGVRSAVSAAEVVKAMDEIGKNLKDSYKERSTGGLAVTIRGRDDARCGQKCKICCD